MKVTMIVKLTGSHDGIDWPDVGEEVDLPEAEAVGLLGSGLARAVKSAPEKATANPVVETAAKAAPAARKTKR